MSGNDKNAILREEMKSSTGPSCIVGTVTRRPAKTTVRERELERSHDTDQRRLSLEHGATHISAVFCYD